MLHCIRARPACCLLTQSIGGLFASRFYNREESPQASILSGVTASSGQARVRECPSSLRQVCLEPAELPDLYKRRSLTPLPAFVVKLTWKGTPRKPAPLRWLFGLPVCSEAKPAKFTNRLVPKLNPLAHVRGLQPCSGGTTSQLPPGRSPLPFPVELLSANKVASRNSEGPCGSEHYSRHIVDVKGVLPHIVILHL